MKGQVSSNLLVEAIEQERRELGNQLHDQVCQTLASSSMLLETVTRAVQAKKSVPVERLEALRGSMESVIHELRRLSRRLNPVDLQGTGFMTAIAALGEGDPRFLFCCEKPVLLQRKESALALYRAAQESWLEMQNHPDLRLNLALQESAGQMELSIDAHEQWLSKPREELIRAYLENAGGEIERLTKSNRAGLICRVPSDSRKRKRDLR